MARLQRFVNTASTTGGDGTSNGTTGATRAYPTVRAAFAAITDNLTLLSPDTVVVKGQSFANIALEIICDKAGGDDTSSGGSTRTNISTLTADTTHKVLLRAADNSWHDKLKLGTGYALKYSVGTSGLGTLSIDTTLGAGCWVVAGIEFNQTNAATNRHGAVDQSYGSSSPDGERDIWYSCIFHTAGAASAGFRRNSRVNTIMCRSTGNSDNGFDIGSSGNNSGTWGCLADSNGGLGFAIGTAPDGTNTMYNNASVNNTGSDYTAGMTLLAGTNNAAEDGSAPGTSAQQAISFTDAVDFAAPSTNDFTPFNGGDLYNTGADLVALALIASSVDAIGTTRPQSASWDIGPLEYAAANNALNANAQAIATASAGLSTSIKLAAAAADQATAAAPLTTAIQLALAALSSAAASGLLTTQIRLAANAQDVATAQGTFGGAVLQAAAFDVAAAVAVLTTSIRFSGTAHAQAGMDAALTNWATVTLAGTLYTGAGSVLDPSFWLDDVPSVGTTLYYDPTFIEIAPNGEISSNNNDCTAVVQFFGPNGLALGIVVVTPKLVAYARGSAAASAQLSTAIQLAAAANALATATANFSTGASIHADAADVATLTATLVTGIPLSALLAAVVTATAALTTQIRLAATAGAQATATANLNGVISLNAAGQAIATALANLTAQVRFEANAQANASAVGSLTAAIRMDAAAQSIVSAAGTLSTAITFGGHANDVASASADLSTARLLIASAIDVVTSIATLSTGVSLRANAASIVQAAAQLEVGIQLLANAADAASASAELTDVISAPPVGAYESDPRYVVTRPRWAFLPLLIFTPRFNRKDPADAVVLTFDLTSSLAANERLQGPITLTLRTLAGSDASPQTLQRDVPSYDVARKKILLPVDGGLNGRWYYIKVAAATSNPRKTISLAGLLPVME